VSIAKELVELLEKFKSGEISEDDVFDIIYEMSRRRKEARKADSHDQN